MDLVNYISKLNTNVFALRNDDDLADRYVKFIFYFFYFGAPFTKKYAL
jgi:hypothetical protein